MRTRGNKKKVQIIEIPEKVDGLSRVECMEKSSEVREFKSGERRGRKWKSCKVCTEDKIKTIKALLHGQIFVRDLIR